MRLSVSYVGNKCIKVPDHEQGLCMGLCSILLKFSETFGKCFFRNTFCYNFSWTGILNRGLWILFPYTENYWQQNWLLLYILYVFLHCPVVLKLLQLRSLIFLNQITVRIREVWLFFKSTSDLNICLDNIGKMDDGRTSSLAIILTHPVHRDTELFGWSEALFGGT